MTLVFKGFVFSTAGMESAMKLVREIKARKEEMS